MEKPKFIIVGAGDFSPEEATFLKEEGNIICAADAGYRTLRSVNIIPDILIGDFDSMSASEIPHEPGLEVITLPVEKDDTDTAYAVKEGFRRGFTRFEIHGALGGDRISHSAANITLLTTIKDMGGYGEIISGNTHIFILSGKESVEIEGKEGDHLSVFSLTEETVLSLKGLYYPLDHGVITRGFPLGVSNHFIGLEASVEVHKGEALIIVEK